MQRSEQSKGLGQLRAYNYPGTGSAPFILQNTGIRTARCAVQVQLESADVAEERLRVEALATDDPDASIVLRDLCKVYPAEVRAPLPAPPVPPPPLLPRRA